MESYLVVDKGNRSQCFIVGVTLKSRLNHFMRTFLVLITMASMARIVCVDDCYWCALVSPKYYRDISADLIIGITNSNLGLIDGALEVLNGVRSRDAALGIAMNYDKTEDVVIEYLIQKGIDKSHNFLPSLFSAIAIGNLRVAEILLKKANVDVNEEYSGRTVLGSLLDVKNATPSNLLACFEFLRKAGVSVFKSYLCDRYAESCNTIKPFIAAVNDYSSNEDFKKAVFKAGRNEIAQGLKDERNVMDLIKRFPSKMRLQ